MIPTQTTNVEEDITGKEDSGMDLSSNYSSAVSEVSSREFEATYSKKYKDPKDFKQELWKNVGPLPERMCYYPYYPTRILRLFKHNLTSYQTTKNPDLISSPIDPHKLDQFLITMSIDQQN